MNERYHHGISKSDESKNHKLPVVEHARKSETESDEYNCYAMIEQDFLNIWKFDGLKFDADVFDFIVNKAIEFKLGARGLRSICEAILNEAMFELPSKEEKEFRVTKAYAEAQFSKSKLAKLKVA